MSKKPGSKGRKPNGSSWKDRLHLIDFSRDEEDEIKEWYSKNTVPWQTMYEELLDSGCSVKATPPSRQDDYWVSITVKDSGSDWYEHTFTIRYPDFISAMTIAYYFFTVHLVEGRYQTERGGGSRDWLK